MKEIEFNLCFCSMGISECELYSENIKIYKPYETIKQIIYDNELIEHKIMSIKDLLNYLMKNKLVKEEIDTNNINNFNYRTIYIEYDNYFFGLQEDKEVLGLFEYFNTNNLKLTFIFVAGGASFHCSGFLFKVNPNEEIHKNSPHVHVIKDGVSVRYSLVTLERFEKDKFSIEHKKAEKKVIIPYLTNNQDKLLEYWNHYMNGFLPPTKDEQNAQYCRES